MWSNKDKDDERYLQVRFIRRRAAGGHRILFSFYIKIKQKKKKKKKKKIMTVRRKRKEVVPSRMSYAVPAPGQVYPFCQQIDPLLISKINARHAEYVETAQATGSRGPENGGGKAQVGGLPIADNRRRLHGWHHVVNNHH